jgi:hypothetical protein
MRRDGHWIAQILKKRNKNLRGRQNGNDPLKMLVKPTFRRGMSAAWDTLRAY